MPGLRSEHLGVVLSHIPIVPLGVVDVSCRRRWCRWAVWWGTPVGLSDL